MKSYPYTIDNGHWEQLTFTGVVHGPDVIERKPKESPSPAPAVSMRASPMTR
jgi:hypothetical protein